MTKEDLMLRFYNPESGNYKEAQRRIADAMMAGEPYVYLPGKSARNEFEWNATKETIERLKEDGFKIDEVWEPWDYWSVEWGY